MKILGPNDVGRGILIEMDAGYISATDERNLKVIQEQKTQLDYSNPLNFMPYYKSTIHQIEMVVFTQKKFSKEKLKTIKS